MPHRDQRAQQGAAGNLAKSPRIGHLPDAHRTNEGDTSTTWRARRSAAHQAGAVAPLAQNKEMRYSHQSPVGDVIGAPHAAPGVTVRCRQASGRPAGVRQHPKTAAIAPKRLSGVDPANRPNQARDAALQALQRCRRGVPAASRRDSGSPTTPSQSDPHPFAPARRSFDRLLLRSDDYALRNDDRTRSDVNRGPQRPMSRTPPITAVGCATPGFVEAPRRRTATRR